MEGQRLPYLRSLVAAILLAVATAPGRTQERDSGAHAFSSRGLDTRLFYDLNRVSPSGNADGVMKFASGSLLPLTVAVPTVMVVGGLAQSDNTRGWKTASDGITIAAGVVATLALQELLIKPLVRRDRPYRSIDSVRWIDSSATGYSFPSSHAATSWGLAVGLSLRYPKWYVIAPTMSYAVLVSLSRPYLGVHFPSDILTGAIVGSLVQYVLYRVQYWPRTPRSSTGSYFSAAKLAQPLGLRIVLPLGN